MASLSCSKPILQCILCIRMRCRLAELSHSVQGQPQIRHMTCSTEPYGVTASFGLHNKPVNAMWEFSKVNLLHNAMDNVIAP